MFRVMKGHTGPKDVVGMKTAMRPSDATFAFQSRQSSWVLNETLQAMSLFDAKNISSQDPPALPSKHLQSEENLIITSEQSIPN